jgi:hypothetical protein
MNLTKFTNNFEGLKILSLQVSLITIVKLLINNK